MNQQTINCYFCLGLATKFTEAIVTEWSELCTCNLGTIGLECFNLFLLYIICFLENIISVA